MLDHNGRGSSLELAQILFLDFDGTISRRDVIDAILEEFADRKWLEIEQLWVNGAIGSRECLRRQFDLVRASPTALFEFVDSFELDDGVFGLIEHAHAAGWPVHIVSDGFTFYINRLLVKRAGRQSMLPSIHVWANELTAYGNDRWQPSFPYEASVCKDGCATCKPAVMQRANPGGARSIFVGDGLSDRFAASNADDVYAKGKLADFCTSNGFPFRPYTILSEVDECLRSDSKSKVGSAGHNLVELKFHQA